MINTSTIPEVWQQSDFYTIYCQKIKSKLREAHNDGPTAISCSHSFPFIASQSTASKRKHSDQHYTQMFAMLNNVYEMLTSQLLQYGAGSNSERPCQRIVCRNVVSTRSWTSAVWRSVRSSVLLTNSKSFGSVALTLRAKFHDRCAIGTIDFIPSTLLYSYRSAASWYCLHVNGPTFHAMLLHHPLTQQHNLTNELQFYGILLHKDQYVICNIQHIQQNIKTSRQMTQGRLHRQKMSPISPTLRKMGSYLAEEYATSQLHCCSHVEVNKKLLAYVILFKCIKFPQYFACLREKIFNCCNVLMLSWRWS